MNFNNIFVFRGVNIFQLKQTWMIFMIMEGHEGLHKNIENLIRQITSYRLLAIKQSLSYRIDMLFIWYN